MALDPAPTVLGPPADPMSDAVADAAVDDAGRLRRTAQRQWAARRDLERRLHDGAALRISALTLRLGLLQHRHPAGEHQHGEHQEGEHQHDEHEFRVAVQELQDELHVVLQELRDIAGMLYPPLLDEAGLGPALREAADRCPAPVRIDAPDERFGPDVEGALYFALLGCLPGGSAPPVDTGPGEIGPGEIGPGEIGPVEIVVRREDGDVVVLVRGGVACQNVGADGVRLLGGSVTVGAPVLGFSVLDPPVITVRIPCV